MISSVQNRFTPQSIPFESRALPFKNLVLNSRAFASFSFDAAHSLNHAYMLVCADDETANEFFTLAAAAVFCAENKSGDKNADGNTHGIFLKNDKHAATFPNGKTASFTEAYGTFAAADAQGGFACKIHAAPPCLKCNECLKVLHGNHPDIVYLNAEGEKIKVGDVKEFLSDLNVKAFSERKLYIVNRADLMSADAQNKMLKSLEEPPASVTFILGVKNEAFMLDTIKSRSRIIRMDLFDADTIYNSLVSSGCDEEKSRIAAACCEGMPGRAKDIAGSDEYAALYKTALDLLSGLKKSGDIAKFDSNRLMLDNFGDFLDVLTVVIRDVMLSAINESLVLSKMYLQQISALSSVYSADALAQIITLVSQTRKKLSLNISAQSALDSFLFSLLEVNFKWQKLSE